MSWQTLAAPAAPTRVEGDPQKIGLLLPGIAYAPDRPLLHYARVVLLSLGWSVQEVWWPEPAPQEPEAQREWVQTQLQTLLAAESARQVMLVGKSMGALAAGVAAQRRLPAIWLTPLLRREQHVADLRQATAPTLLIGGTGDPAWAPKAAADLERDCAQIASLEIDEVDHALETPADPVNSVEVLKRVVRAMERFVADQVPPE